MNDWLKKELYFDVYMRFETNEKIIKVPRAVSKYISFVRIGKFF